MSLYIIMMGVQGAGKGVQASKIAETYGIPHISTGDIFRAMKTRDDDLAQEVQAIMKSGDLVPDDLTCRMVKDRLGEKDALKGAILDGFPRNEVQADWLEEYLSSHGTNVTALFWMELPLYTAFKRAFGRVMDVETGKSYNIYFRDGGIEEWHFEDDPEGKYVPRLVAKLKDGTDAKRRPDDANAHAVLTRIDTYMTETAPLLDFYQDKDIIVTIDANQTIKKVEQDIKAAIDARQASV